MRMTGTPAAIRSGHDPGVRPKLPSTTNETAPGTMPTAVPMAQSLGRTDVSPAAWLMTVTDRMDTSRTAMTAGTPPG